MLHCFSTFLWVRSLAFTLITPSDMSVSLLLIAQDHDGTVLACSFSSDDKLAVSCSATETWVWQAFPPVHRLHQLHPASGAGGRTLRPGRKWPNVVSLLTINLSVQFIHCSCVSKIKPKKSSHSGRFYMGKPTKDGQLTLDILILLYHNLEWDSIRPTRRKALIDFYFWLKKIKIWCKVLKSENALLLQLWLSLFSIKKVVFINNLKME